MASLAALLLFASCRGTSGGGGSEWTGGGPYDSGSISLPSRDESVSFFGPGSRNVMKNLFKPVYFGFDRFDIPPPEMSKIAAVTRYLRAEGRSSTVIIAGFTDSIGTEEYNRQLGERRALAVRAALVGQGIDANRIQTISFGEDMPAAPGNHTANRRAEFGIVRR